MKKIWLPFWSYRIVEIEEWLSAMALEGYHLKKINLLTRCFYFEEGMKQELTYRIGFDRGYYPLSTALVNDGWREVFKSHTWYVLVNEKTLAEVKTAPLREGIITHNRKIKDVYSVLLFVVMVLSISPLVLVFDLLFNNDNVIIEESPMWLVTIAVFLFLWTLPTYTLIKITKSTKLLQINVIEQPKANRNKHAQVVVKLRFGWIYAPDKMVTWLESMEAKGYHLYRMNKVGMFYFQKGVPRKVSYFADCQNTTPQSYFDIHKEAGWRLNYTSNVLFSRWSIWSQPFQEERPTLYSDRSELLNHGRRVMLTHLFLFLPVIALYIYITVQHIVITLAIGNREVLDASVLIPGVAIILYSSFVIKSLLYYRRLKLTEI